MSPIWDDLGPEEISVVLPALTRLLEQPCSAVVAAWFLFDPLAKALGPARTNQALLGPLIGIYEGNSGRQSSKKHLKLYHRTFLQFLIVRLGTSSFLRYFSTYLIEAVGGFKDFSCSNDIGKRTVDEDDFSLRPMRGGLDRLWG